MSENKKIHLKNVRLSFPSLFQRAIFDKTSDNKGKFEATFLFSKDDKKQKKMLDDVIAEAIAEAKIKVPADKRCLKDGDVIFEEKEYDGYEGMWSIKTSTNKRPTVIDRDKSPLIEDDLKPYAGCYVNAILDVWVQNNSWGKRVNANLYGVQFHADGEEFGSGNTDVSDDFDDLDDEDDGL